MLWNGYSFSASDYADSIASLLIESERDNRDKDMEHGAGRFNLGARTCNRQSAYRPLADVGAEKPEGCCGRSRNETQDLADSARFGWQSLPASFTHT
jgi:hypothetical protein